MPEYPLPPDWVLTALREGIVIPAHPLALTAARKLSERRQAALTRYYLAAGAGGVAVGVHTTQFAIREPKHGLLRPVLQLARHTVGKSSRVLIAGICGATEQAVSEAQLTRELGYHAGLLSLAALKSASDDDLITHCRRVAHEIPIFGFYLQPAAGGRLLSYNFWRRFAEIPNVVAIKIAAFNRYQTLDVVRAVSDAGRSADIALYTGNDDAIVIDLLTPGFAGGLLGHWACWTRKAVDLLEECKRARRNKTVPASLLTLATQVTDCNAAFFDAANNYAGCVPGIHEILRRQGLLEGTWCLNPDERLSPGQADEITRVYRLYPHLNDDSFVEEHLSEWLR
ncbi:MAG TPA: dihydrodipicolinate synthase family protein [Verrucomicrobiae bacterium]|nr:dihydrodipicolinate synthase family protein [Verrucomicrobiae bacterium]